MAKKKKLSAKEEEIVQKIEENEKKKTGKLSILQVVTNVFLSITFISAITYLIFVIANSNHVIDQMAEIIIALLFVLFTISFLFVCLSIRSKKEQIQILVSSILLTIFFLFLLLYKADIFQLPTQPYVENFTGKSVTEVIQWGEEHHIAIEQTYEASDSIQEYHIISQNVEAGTLVKDVEALMVTVSNGPDSKKEVIFPNMIGKNVDEVIAFVEDNYFSNVTIDFIVSSEEKDIVISQDQSGQIPRDTEIHIVVSLGEEEEGSTVSMIDLIDKSTFYAITWAKRNRISYTLEYEYSDTITQGHVIRHNPSSATMIDPSQQSIIFTISKGPKIQVPDLMNMNMESITAWIIENHLKIEFSDQYDDHIAIGKPISVSHKQGEILESGETVKVVISKGQLKMEKFSTPLEYRTWAEKYGIAYQETLDFSDTVPSGGIISISHQEGQLIQNNDTIILTVSNGKQITVPNFVGKSKSEIQKTCQNNDLKCSFVYGGYSESVGKDVATKQSKNSGSKVSSSTTITITLSRGLIEKVTVPSFKGQTQASIAGQCSSLGITCKFETESSYSNTQAGVATRQSASGRMNKGSSITVYLSRGLAKSYSIVIQENWFGNTYNETVNTLKSKLESACPGVIFQFQAKDVNEGPGNIHPSSPVKAGKNTFVQGQTYTIIVNR